MTKKLPSKFLGFQGCVEPWSKQSDTDKMTFNVNRITLNITKAKQNQKKKTTLKIQNDPIFIILFVFIQVPLLAFSSWNYGCLSGSNGNLPHSDEVVSVASKQSLRKNKYETICLIQVLKCLPGCCIYTLQLLTTY